MQRVEFLKEPYTMFDNIRSRSDIRADTLFHKAAEFNLTLMNNLAHWLVSSFFLKELRLRVVQSEDVQ